MFRRSFVCVAVVCALAVVSGVVAVRAQTQEPTHYTFVSYWAVPRAQWADFEKSQEQAVSVLEKQVANGIYFTTIYCSSGRLSFYCL